MVARSAAMAKGFKFTAAIFSPPGCGPRFTARLRPALIQLPPPTVARELARQLNHLPASATNE